VPDFAIGTGRCGRCHPGGLYPRRRLYIGRHGVALSLLERSLKASARDVLRQPLQGLLKDMPGGQVAADEPDGRPKERCRLGRPRLRGLPCYLPEERRIHAPTDALVDQAPNLRVRRAG
jgi:hypothetical protein